MPVPRPPLPQHLAERTTDLGGRAPRSGGELVIYWQRGALRAHENPALDAAIFMARHLELPLLVYQGLSRRHPWTSHRVHRFILEGMREVQGELAARGIPSACHVERRERWDEGPVLRRLAARAALVVTEDVPVEPLVTWTRSLAARHPTWAVDASCLVPMPLVGRTHDRAFAFRRATHKLRVARLGHPWPEQDWEGDHEVPDDLPFSPVDLREADLTELVVAAGVDPTIGPLPHTRGGSREGYLRWRDFLASGGLRAYHRARNDAARNGTSRLSPYLHMGMVSPLRIAREAWQDGSEGAEKFLDELLVWRELAWCWCRYGPDPHELSAIPAWAREGLERHAADPREVLSWERLVRGRTGDELWDLAQHSLRVHGELHNNVRMTWGKALPAWSASPQLALERLVDLNHRYALDGRDPASYAGVLWCLGLFDRPFSPPSPILGSVRPRPTEAHARRLDLDAYRTRVERPLRARALRVAVVGAGMAGLTAARLLLDHGQTVRVFDKSRGLGGRLATRRRPDPDAPFDHGAQYFTARDPAFRRLVWSWVEEGLVAAWQGRFARLDGGELSLEDEQAPRYVGLPDMRSLAEHLGRDLEILPGLRVEGLEALDARPGPAHGEGPGPAWRLRCADGDFHGPFDRVLVCTPAAQAVGILDPAPELQALARSREMVPCHAALVRLAEPVPVDLDGLKLAQGPIAWAARDSSKPGRPAGERWVLHARPGWSQEHLEDPSEAVCTVLLEAFGAALGPHLGGPMPEVEGVESHRWRHARPLADRVPGPPARFDRLLGLGVAGDWLEGARIEAAWRSGASLAMQVLHDLCAD